MTWLILKTAYRKEPFVTAALHRMGLEAWEPVIYYPIRPSSCRRLTSKAQLRAFRTENILPGRVFVSSPAIHDREMQSELATLRHVTEMERDNNGHAVMIPGPQIVAFRAEIDRENTAAVALANKATRRQKQKWKALKDALLDLIQTAKEQLEQAA